MSGAVGCRTDQADLLQVKQHKAHLFPQLRGQGPHQLQHQDDAGGVVIGIVPVGRAAKQQPYQKDQTSVAGKQHRQRAFGQAGRQPDCPKHRHAEQQRHNDLIQQIDPHVARCDEVGKRQPRAGIIVGGHQVICFLRVAEQHIPRAQSALFLRIHIAQPLSITADSTAERLLFPFSLAHRALCQHIYGLVQTKTPPSPMTEGVKNAVPPQFAVFSQKRPFGVGDSAAVTGAPVPPYCKFRQAAPGCTSAVSFASFHLPETL